MMKLNATEFQFALKLQVLAKVINIHSRETISSKISIISSELNTLKLVLCVDSEVV